MTRHARAFSLIEILVVLAIAGILASMALPSMHSLLQRQRLQAAVGALSNAIDLTRAQAIARGRRVVLVPLGAAGDDWRSGWVVFVDTNQDRRPGPGEEVISSHGPVDEGINIDFNFTSNRAPYYIAYNGAGRSCSDSSSMAARWGTLSLFSGPEIRRIKISMLGRVRVCNPERGKGQCEGAEAAP